MRQILLFALFLCFSFLLHAQCDPQRYYEKIFDYTVTSDVQYGSAIRYNGNQQDLLLDVYQPLGDTLSRRPLIVLAFGGSFTFGSKTNPDIVPFCQEFVKRGYVVASIDYRLGFPGGNDSDTNQFMALMRGVQDMKAAVRFFYRDAAVPGFNTFKIDTHQIWIGGISAGGFMGLNYAYFKLDTTSRGPIPAWIPDAFTQVGGLEGNSGNAGYSDRVRGVISLCGALADTVWIMPNDPLVVAIHGDQDNLVPCYYDSTNTGTEAQLYGTGNIEQRATHVGLPHSTYIFKGKGHVPFLFNQTYTDSTVAVVRDFLYQNVWCYTSVNDVQQDIAVSLYPNPAEGNMQISNSENKPLNMAILSAEGKLIAQKLLAGNTTEVIDRSSLNAGIYFIRLSDGQSNRVLKTLKAVIY